MKPVRLSHHACGYLSLRGFTEEEVAAAIERGEWVPAAIGVGRLECEREFPFGTDWNGRRYETKKVRPVSIELESEILVVTVHTYYY